MMTVLGLFLLAYLVVGYLLFTWGLRYVYELPGIGLVLVERVLYILYYFFFVMLVFSNAILLYSGIFRGKETAWLLTLPVRQDALFCWKIVESFVISSWGLAILTAPLLLSFGKVFRADAAFYAKSLLVSAPFMALPAVFAAILVVLLVRFWGKVAKLFLLLVMGFLVWKGVDSWLFARTMFSRLGTTSTSLGIRQVLGHTEFTTHPLLPSSWMSEMILHWSRGYASRGVFYGLLLLSYGLMGAWLCLVIFSRWLYPCWNLSQQRKSARAWSKARPDFLLAEDGLPALPDTGRSFLQMLGLSRVNAALIRKDIREFIRDPSQWVPCSVMFGLLFFYSLNLDRFTVDPNDPYWVTLVSYLNFGVCCLAVSTLSTRFIFPLFSLEGRRLWILGLAPFSMQRIFMLKLLLFALATATLNAFLMLLSGTRLLLPWPTIFTFMGGITLISFGLTAMSLSLGVLFPNFQESNPSKIVSGFGGTLCVILNFVFVFVFMGLFIAPAIVQTPRVSLEFEKFRPWVYGLSLGGMVVLTAVAAGLPIFFSLRRMKKLETLGKL